MSKHTQSQNQRRNMMLNEPISRIIPKMAIPTIVAFLINSIYSLADTYFVSSLGTNATAAVRYHVVRQVYWAMERVRKNEQNKLSPRFRKYFKKSRFLLSKPLEKLTEEEMEKLSLMFEIAPRLADAYRLKNEFLAVIRMKSSVQGRQKLADWLLSVEVMDLPEFYECTKAYRNWFNEILNSMDVPWSNGFIEGCNNKTKVLKRVCFGMRNFSNFRKRILFCNT